VGVQDMVTKGANHCGPGTNKKRPKIALTVTSIALRASWYSMVINSLGLPVQSGIESPRIPSW